MCSCGAQRTREHRGVADEAHHSQYGFGGRVNEKGEMSYGFASNLRDALPDASFFGLTPSLPPLGRATPNALRCLCRSAPPPSSHRHAHREDRRQYADGVRRLHLMLPPPPCGALQAGGGCVFERDGQPLQGAGGFHRRDEGRQGRPGIYGSQDERLPRGRDGRSLRGG